jgi:hypothetical protein
MNILLSLTAVQLNHAADLKEKIVKLEKELASILWFRSSMSKRGPGRPKKLFTIGPVEGTKIRRRKMSAAARAKMAAAAKARWAKAKAAGNSSL